MNQPLRVDSMISAMEQAHSSLSCAALNKRERDVVFLAIKGFTNKAIARELNITEGTVKVHLHNVYQKFGIGSRSALAALVMK
jgi:two-component system nitrate/nitrite response regulator NarL